MGPAPPSLQAAQFLAAIVAAGVLLTGYSTKAYQAMGDAYLLPAIAAVVLGGAAGMMAAAAGIERRRRQDDFARPHIGDLGLHVVFQLFHFSFGIDQLLTQRRRAGKRRQGSVAPHALHVRLAEGRARGLVGRINGGGGRRRLDGGRRRASLSADR